MEFTSAALEEDDTGRKVWESTIVAYFDLPANPYAPEELTEEGADGSQTDAQAQQ